MMYIQFMTCNLASGILPIIGMLVFFSRKTRYLKLQLLVSILVGASSFLGKSLLYLRRIFFASDLPRLPEAFIFLFGLIYAFNLHYPKKPHPHVDLYPDNTDVFG